MGSRRSSGRRKKGKCIRRARAGLTSHGMTTTANLDTLSGTKKKQFAKRETERLERRLDRLDAGETNSTQAGTDAADEQLAKAPHSFVINRGNVGKSVLRLVKDVRRCMEPFTASKLKPMKRNKLKDFVVNASPLGVSHMLVLTKSETAVNMRIVKLPHGPTITFKVNDYCLSKDIASSLKRQTAYVHALQTQPLLVMNNFLLKPLGEVEKMEEVKEEGEDEMDVEDEEMEGEQKEEQTPEEKTRSHRIKQRHMSLVQTLLQNMLPTIKIDTMDLSRVKRTLLINYDSAKDCIDWRHYSVKNIPCSISKGVKKVVTRPKVPDLSRLTDIADLVLKPEVLSDSEFEGDGANEVVIPQDLGGRALDKGSKTSVRLVEIGPRMSLQLVKIEEGVCSGDVMYHAYEKRSEHHVHERKQIRQENIATKRVRRDDQESRIARKAAEKEAHRLACLEGTKKKYADVTKKTSKDGGEPKVESDKMTRKQRKEMREKYSKGRR